MAERDNLSYPAPQVEVHTARDIGPVADAPKVSTPDKNAGVTDVYGTEVGRGGDYVIGVPIQATKAVLRGVKKGLEWFGREALLPAMEKLVPMGGQEITGFFYGGGPYSPYGATSESVPMGEGGVHGPADEQKAALPAVTQPNGHQVFGPEQEAPANDNAKIIDMQPQIDGYDPTQYARSSAPQIEQKRGRSR